MKYCVIKDTATIIDGSENPVETMFQNAINAGFAESEVEILTEEEYLSRVKNEPKPMQEPTLEEKNRADIDYLSIMTGVDLGV